MIFYSNSDWRLLPVKRIGLVSIVIEMSIITAAGFFSTGSTAPSAVPGQKDVTKIIFDDRRIEGKIRRPQLVLIKAEQRPEFDPMVLQSLGKTGNIAGAVDKAMLETSPYDGAFQFRGKRIVNYIP
jgi:hypothetical protein